MNRRTARRALLAATAVVVGVAVMPTAGAAAKAHRTRVHRVTAHRHGSTVTVSGWATFSGAVLASHSDSAKDAKAGGAAAGGELTDADVVYRPELGDLFFRLKVTSIPTVGPLVGDPGLLYGVRTVISGVPVDFRAQTTGATAEFGIFKCNGEGPPCASGPTLNGGFGTTGQEIVFAVPFSVLNGAGLKISEGSSIGTPIVYTANASYNVGIVNDNAQIVDEIVTGSKATMRIPTKSVTLTAGGVTKHATLKDGYFHTSFPASAIPSKHTQILVKTCLDRCVRQRMQLNVT